MRTKVTIFLILCALSFPVMAQVAPSAYSERSRLHLKAGAGLDYWMTDYSQVWKYGPSAWVSGDVWHSVGVIVEGHSVIEGGNLPQYKYYTGEGGLLYTVYKWRTIQPYAKAEMGFAGLSFPRPGTNPSHDTRNIWAIGGGADRRITRHIWARVDYTYEGFPEFLSYVTLQKHTLNPNGFTVGGTYHF